MPLVCFKFKMSMQRQYTRGQSSLQYLKLGSSLSGCQVIYSTNMEDSTVTIQDVLLTEIDRRGKNVISVGRNNQSSINWAPVLSE